MRSRHPMRGAVPNEDAARWLELRLRFLAELVTKDDPQARQMAKDIVDGADPSRSMRLDSEHGGTVVSDREGWVLRFLVWSFGQAFDEVGAKNYLHADFYLRNGGPRYEVTLQRAEGVSPHARAVKAEAEVERLRTEAVDRTAFADALLERLDASERELTARRIEVADLRGADAALATAHEETRRWNARATEMEAEVERLRGLLAGSSTAPPRAAIDALHALGGRWLVALEWPDGGDPPVLDLLDAAAARRHLNPIPNARWRIVSWRALDRNGRLFAMPSPS